MANIHPTAIIASSASLGENVSIGAYSIIEDNAVIGDGTQIRHHCIIGRKAIIGKNNNIHNHVCIGMPPQDLKYKNEDTNSIVGDENIIREFVTINNGTGDNGYTVIGNKNCILSYSHIAHDDRFGNNIIMSNSVQLAGHVTVEDNVVFGGCAAVHQFCRVGKFTMVGAGAIIVKDVPPFALIDREPAYHGINKIGLMRNNFDADTMRQISDFYKLIFKSGFNNSDGIRYYQEKTPSILPEIQYCIDFIINSERGVLR